MGRLTVEQRRALGEAALQGVSITQLDRLYKCSRSVARDWRDEAKKPHPCYEDKPGRGRKKATTAAQRKDLKQQARRRSSIRKILSKNRNSGLSKTTIWRVLQGGRHPLTWGKVIRGRPLSNDNKDKRLKFAQRSNLPKAKHLVFTDSKFVYCIPDKAGNWEFCWYDRLCERTYPASSNPLVLHFYSAVAHGHKAALVFVPPTPVPGQPRENFCSRHFITAITTLQREFKHWFPAGTQYHVIMDHAKQHDSKQSQAALERLGVNVLPGYPPQSWDLNIIENCWGMMTQNMGGHHPRSLEGYKKWVKGAWDKVSIRSINKLVASWEERLAACEQSGGAWPL
jgi:transposase